MRRVIQSLDGFVIAPMYGLNVSNALERFSDAITDETAESARTQRDFREPRKDGGYVRARARERDKWSATSSRRAREWQYDQRHERFEMRLLRRLAHAIIQ